jgi:competence protein ComEC
MRFADFPFLRYLPFLIAGILVATFFSVHFSSLPVVGLLLSWILYVWGVGKNQPLRLGFSAALGYFMFFLLGFSMTCEKGRNQLQTPARLDSFQGYLAEIQRYDLDKPNSKENLVELLAVRDSMAWRPIAGKILVYHKSDRRFQPGDLIWFQKKPEEISGPTFPDEFDYKGFLAKKGIFYRQFIGNDFVVIGSSESRNPKFALVRLRENLARLIDSKIHHKESKQIALALLIGQKESLDKEIRNAYAETGTMHILAVSGLHVGIIYAVFLFPLRAFYRSKKNPVSYLVFVILTIWVYAAMTGFSPSVVRASVMFSLILAGQMRKRKPSIWNILAFSAMLMLTIDPNLLFDIGFQLSYLAVAGIVGLQPLILRWWLPPNRIVEYFWQLVAVSIAAQLVTFPLSLYYFHLFPTYFLLANLIVVPLAFLIMSVGVPLLLVGWIPFVGDFLGFLVDWMIFLQNQVNNWILALPFGTFERLTITFSGMIWVWFSLLIWGNWELGNRRKMTFIFLLFSGIWLGERLIREIQRPSNQLFLFSNEKGTLIDLQLGKQHFSWNQDFPPDQISYAIDPNRLRGQRAKFPVTLRGIREEDSIWFPGLGIRFYPTEKFINWDGQKPDKIQEFRR